MTMTTTMNPVFVVRRARRMGLDLDHIGQRAMEKAFYFYTPEDNYALFNFYMALSGLCHRS